MVNGKTTVFWTTWSLEWSKYISLERTLEVSYKRKLWTNENETDSYNDEPLVNTFSGGIVYDTDCKYHYDRIVVVPSNDKWRNSSNYSKSNCSTNSSDTSYSVPKPLPRRDSLRARTKSVFQSRPEQLVDTNNVNNIVGGTQLQNNSAVVCKLGPCSTFNSRANSAPPAPPPQPCNPNRFTWWFGSSAAPNQIHNSSSPNKVSRYVVRVKYIMICAYIICRRLSILCFFCNMLI